MRLTQRKGDTAVTQAVASFTRLGFDVLLPVTESAAYDLAVDDKGVIKRVQARFMGSREVDLRRIHSNSKGYVVKKTKEDAYDWLYVLRANGSEYLFTQCFAGRRSIVPKPINLLHNTVKSVG